MPIYRKKRIILLSVVGILTPMVQPLSALSDTSNNTSIQTSFKNNDITNTQNKNDKKDFDNAHSSVLTSSDITPSQTESEGKMRIFPQSQKQQLILLECGEQLLGR